MELKTVRDFIKRNQENLPVIVQVSEINLIEKKIFASSSKSKYVKNRYYGSFQIVKKFYKPIIRIE